MRVKSLSSHLGVTGNHESLARHKITVRVSAWPIYSQISASHRQDGGLPHSEIQRRFAYRFHRRRRLGRSLAHGAPRPFKLANSGPISPIIEASTMRDFGASRVVSRKLACWRARIPDHCARTGSRAGNKKTPTENGWGLVFGGAGATTLARETLVVAGYTIFVF